MARPDKREKQLKRARAEIDTALSRGRLVEAADSLLTLPAGERERGAASLAARLVDEQERLLRAREVAQLLAWRTRCEREPRLLPADPDEIARVRWCWLIAAIRTGNWPRAQTIFTELEPALAAWSARAALSALITHEGRPEPCALEALAAEAERLGYDAPPKRASYPCPARAEEVEAACLTCFALEPWPRFRAVVSEWLARAPRDVTREILRVAPALSRRELVVQAARDPRGALEVARWCALWCVQAERPPAMEPVLALCVRVAAQVLVGTVAERRVVEACAPIVAASLGYASLVESVNHVALAPLYALELADAAERLLRSLVEQAPSPRAILKLSAILAMQQEHGDKSVALPPWLVPAFEIVLRQPEALAAAIGEPAARTPALYLLDALPLALCVRACVSLFPVADERARELLARAAEDAVVRMRERPTTGRPLGGLREFRAMLERFDPDFSRQMSDADVRRYLATPDGKELQRHLMTHGEFDLAESVPEALRTQLDQLAAPLLPYSLGLLDEVLAFGGSSAEERALVTRFWSRRPSLTARFDALVAANEQECDRALALLERELLRDYLPDGEDAARALLRADRIGAPRTIQKKIAEVLLRTLAESPAQMDKPRIAEALCIAGRLVKPRAARPARKRKQAPQGEKPKAPARASKKAAPKRQVELFREEDNAP